MLRIACLPAIEFLCWQWDSQRLCLHQMLRLIWSHWEMYLKNSTQLSEMALAVKVCFQV